MTSMTTCGAGQTSLLVLIARCARRRCRPARAQSDYPSKPVRIIVPSSPGGGTDTVARLLAQHLSEKLGQQFFIENRPGGGSATGIEAAARAAPDGYTLVDGREHDDQPARDAKDHALRRGQGFRADHADRLDPNVLVVHPSLPVQNASPS